MESHAQNPVSYHSSAGSITVHSPCPAGLPPATSCCSRPKKVPAICGLLQPTPLIFLLIPGCPSLDASIGRSLEHASVLSIEFFVELELVNVLKFQWEKPRGSFRLPFSDITLVFLLRNDNLRKTSL